MTLISIIIPAYNNAATVKRAVNSCLQQTHRELEVLVVDNGSSDKTPAIVQALVAQDSRVRLLTSPNGRSRARNAGLKAAKGELLQFLDADDELLPTKLEAGLAKMAAQPTLDAVVTATKYVSAETTKVVDVAWAGREQLLDANVLPISAVLFKNQALVYFDERLEFNEDWLFWTMNLYGKALAFDAAPGDVIHVEDSGTMMKRFAEMRLSEIAVRARIKRRFSHHSKRLFRRDLRLASAYLINHPEHPDIAVDTRGLRGEIMLMKLMFILPNVRKHFAALEAQTKRRSLYA